jgi:iron complex outermembrane recepter protein
MKVRIPALFTRRCRRNTPGPSKSELAESIRGFSGSWRFIALGFVMNCSRSMTPSGMILVQETSNQGIEASLEVELLREILVAKQSKGSGDRLSLDQSYTLNDFHFDQNSVYGDNRIAGIPIHVYEAQLLYESPFGFYAGPNLECNLSRYPVDEANTLFADSYVLLGFRAGFRRSNGFSVFIDCRNLTNQRYAASIDVIADARTEPNPEIFHPGDGRSFYGGVSWSW